MLLLAFFGALALLLSSLSIQTAALQSRSSDFSLRQRAKREDWLSSAAHLVAGRLQRYPCLLPLLLVEWEGPEAPCITSDALEQLRRGTLPSPDTDAGSYTITGYSPVREPSVDLTLIGADLELEWQPKRGPVSLRRFRIALLPGPRLGGIQP